MKENIYVVFLELFNVGLDLKPSNTQSLVLFNRSFKSDLPYLHELHMNNMPNLTYITAGAMSNLIALRELYLSHNPHLSSIHPDTFSSRRHNEESEEWPPILKVSVMCAHPEVWTSLCPEYPVFNFSWFDNEKENWRILTNKEIYASVKKPTIIVTVRLNRLH